MANDILSAYQLASRLHEGQTDKAGRPYIEHLTRVFLRVQAAGGDATQLIAALLHDCIEDGRATVDGLRSDGVPQEAIVLIVALTRQAGQSYPDYLAGVLAVQGARLIKMADVEDNSDEARLSLLSEKDAERLRKKYAEAFRALDIHVSPKTIRGT
ncbi:HD domain-containing protein [Diaphorobacter sp. J5-51]|uniref:HD domain-containing protein n=1 Tax=Diaphorobacter sp. J5-51 TaxID=680496 RepID=UPI0006436586|nr:HD domain-containing protein [Diaphorobacter sp. J5-51]